MTKYHIKFNGNVAANLGQCQVLRAGRIVLAQIAFNVLGAVAADVTYIAEVEFGLISAVTYDVNGAEVNTFARAIGSMYCDHAGTGIAVSSPAQSILPLNVPILAGTNVVVNAAAITENNPGVMGFIDFWVQD
jgi:hypothetical protein